MNVKYLNSFGENIYITLQWMFTFLKNVLILKKYITIVFDNTCIIFILKVKSPTNGGFHLKWKHSENKKSLFPFLNFY